MYIYIRPLIFTAPFNNMQTPTFEAQPTIAFFTTINQMFGGSSQLLTTAEHTVIKLLCKHLIDGSEKCICRSRLEFESPYVTERRSNKVTTIQVLR